MQGKNFNRPSCLELLCFRKFTLDDLLSNRKPPHAVRCEATNERIWGLSSWMWRLLSLTNCQDFGLCSRLISPHSLGGKYAAGIGDGFVSLKAWHCHFCRNGHWKIFLVTIDQKFQKDYADTLRKIGWKHWTNSDWLKALGRYWRWVIFAKKHLQTRQK